MTGIQIITSMFVGIIMFHICCHFFKPNQRNLSNIGQKRNFKNINFQFFVVYLGFQMVDGYHRKCFQS